MSFLHQQSDRPSKRRKKHDGGGHLKSNFNDQHATKSHDSLLVVGYQSKIFRDDLMAQYIEDGRHLIAWMGDESLMVDRYDCRGYFYSQDDFGLATDDVEVSFDDKGVDDECDKYRYYGLSEGNPVFDKDENNGSNTTAYSNVNYDYYHEAEKIDDGDKEYDPSDCFVDANQEPEIKKPLMISSKQALVSHASQEENSNSQTFFSRPEGLDIPDGMDVPDSQKSQSIIERTALFISKHGTQMEIVLKAKQSGNPQFDFLNFGNWLNPYYKLILAKVKEGTYKVVEDSNVNNGSQNKEDPTNNSESSESDSSDEYIHPLLQAHRRPVKTKAEASSDSENASVARASIPASYVIPKPFAGTNLYANAAEVYMTRKYEHLRKDRTKKELKTDVEDNWADQLEEDKDFSLFDKQFSNIDQIDKQLAYGMLQYLQPPPPPPPSALSASASASPSSVPVQSSSASTSALIQGVHVTQTIPAQPPPPGENTSTEDPSVPYSAHRYQQQNQLDRIIPPPPDFKSVVDKLAEYVARNGEVFQEQIKNKNDPRFQFLNADDIYYPYYLYKKQQCIMEVKADEASQNMDMKCKEKPEKTTKPLSFSLKKPTVRAKEKKLKVIEVFNSIHEDRESDADEGMQESFDGYRPNKVEKKTEKTDQTMEEKAKETMEKAKIVIAEAQKKQRELQQDADRGKIDPEVQMERRRKAAAFIGMLKKVEVSSSSSESSSDEEDIRKSDEDEEDNLLQKRHFKENKQ